MKICDNKTPIKGNAAMLWGSQFFYVYYYPTKIKEKLHVMHTIFRVYKSGTVYIIIKVIVRRQIGPQ